MTLDDKLFTCRRLRQCREKLLAVDMLRDEASGRLFCKAGMCPNGKNRSATDLIDLQVEIRKLRTDLRTQTVDKE